MVQINIMLLLFQVYIKLYDEEHAQKLDTEIKVLINE